MEYSKDWIFVLLTAVGLGFALNRYFRQIRRSTQLLRESEERLRQNEERYRGVVEDQTEVICRFKADGTLTFVNEIYCRFFGKTSEELVRSKWHPQAVAGDLDLVEEKLGTLSPAHPVITIENRVYSAKGEVRTMQFVNRGFFDAAGRLVETQSVGRDVTDEKQMEVKLRDSEERYRRLFETETDAILLVDCTTYELLDVNDSALKLYGYSREECLQLRVTDLSTEPDKTRDFILTKGWKVPLRWHRKKDGTPFPVEISGSYFESGGRPLHVAAVRDITERKQAEDALNESEARFRSMADGAPAIIWVTDADGNNLFTNRLGFEFSGLTAEEAVGMGWQRALHPEDLPQYLRDYSTALEQRKSFESEHRLRARTGEYHWMKSINTPRFTPSGNFAGFVGCSFDVSDFKRVQQELTNALEQLRLVLDAARMGAFCWDLSTGGVEWTEEHFRIFGYEPFSVQPTYELWRRHLHPDDVPAVIMAAERAKAEKKVWHCEHRVNRVDGEVRRISVRGQFTYDSKGVALQARGVVFDITDALRLETLQGEVNDRRKLEAEVLASVERERQRLGRELHDGLSQLLTAAKFRLSLMERKLERQIALDVSELRSVEQEMNQAMEEARAMSHGLNPLHLVGQGLGTALQQLAQNVVEAHSLRCECNLETPIAIADHEVALHLYRIAQEATQNAVRHAHCRQIWIRLEDLGEFLALRVLDDGIGCRQLSQSSGMGLQNMQARAQAIGGWLDIQLRREGGTVVTCAWPAKTVDSRAS